MASKRKTHCQLHTSTHRSGMKFAPYTYLPFHGLYTEDGDLLRGTEGEAKGPATPIPAPAVAAPKNCCGRLGRP